ncbi:MAG TPA: von Willebrand factor type A domain-containing protein [Opitutaceae bacterium]|nr:von Willebrand factor type A domain-containing protein [Opitutaceae bacterium]
MNPFDPIRLNPDDPRLTAYALGELEGDEAAQVAAAIAADPALQAAVAEIRATAGQLAEALEAEPLPEPAPVVHRAVYHTVRPARVFRLPYFALAGLAAAACLTFIVALRVWPTREAEAKKQTLALTGQAEARQASAPAATAPAGSPIELQFAREEAGKAPPPAGFTPERMDHLAAVVPNPPPGEKVAADASMAENIGRVSGGAAAGEVRSALQAETKDETIKLSPFEVKAEAVQGYAAESTLAGARLKTAPAPAMAANEPAADAYGKSAARSADLDTSAAVSAGAARSIPWAAPAGWDDASKIPGRRAAIAAAAPSVTEAAGAVGDNDFRAAAQNPLSTFAVDVDTASYGAVRQFLATGRRPPRDTVRIEGLVNHFTYAYVAPPASAPAPFAAALEVASAPWAPAHRLVRIGLKAREAPAATQLAPVVARDVKVQVEFNPATVQAYRLLGYEDRRRQQDDVNNDRIDAGDIGAGYTVTALYEVIPVGVEWKPAGTVDALKYQAPADAKPQTQNAKSSAELLTVKIRYQAPEGGAGRVQEFPLTDRGAAFAEASADFKFAAAVAGFGMVLRDSAHKGTETLADVARWAAEGAGSDATGDRAEFLSLVKRAGEILPTQG